MLGLKGLKIGIQVKLLNNTTTKHSEVTMSNTRKTREIVTSIINRGLLNLEPTVPNINALHRAIMSVLDKNKDLSVNIQVDNDVMENIFVTALEGGSNYWYEIQDYTLEIVRSVEPDGPLSVATWKAIAEHGAEIDVYDAESEDILGTLTYDSIKDRLQLINDEGQALVCMMNMITGDYDAGDADAVFQYLVMGEVAFG